MSEYSEELAKHVFKACLAFVLLGTAFFLGALAHRKDLPPFPQLRYVYDSIFVDDLVSSSRIHHLQPSRGQGTGVTRNEVPDDGAMVFMTGFFDDENQIRLIRRDGTLVNKWSLDYLEHFPDPEVRVCDVISPLRVDTHGAHATPNGEVVFNYEYCGSVKLDRCGEVVWTIPKPTHHSLVPSADGGYWLLGRYEWLASEEPDRFPPISSAAQDQVIFEDILLKISEEGEIVEEISVPQLMRENSLEALLTSTGDNLNSISSSRAELVHTNKIAELPQEIAESYPLFSAGDLAISMRNFNLIMVIDPVGKKIKWYQTGPWLRQHDPEFRSDGRISVFNNNVYRTAYDNEQTDLSTPYTTNIMAIDPVSRETEVIFGERPGQELLSVIRGQHELLDEGGMLITEFDAGRILEVDADGRIVWEYVNSYNEEFVGEVTNSVLYPEDYFQSGRESCPN